MRQRFRTLARLPFLAATLFMCAALWGLQALSPPGMPWILGVVMVPYWAACYAINRVSRPGGIPPHPPAGSFCGHSHLGPGAGPCPQCLVTLGMLAGLVGALFDTILDPDEAGERVASTGEIRGAPLLAQVLQWTAAIDDEAASYMAAWDAQAAEVRRALGGPLSTVPPCHATLDRHLCRERTPGTHTHKCRCGTTWGVIL